jgi:hypothetical protein|tara:strand:+ start:3476 stop:3907 length:432 start_codon:yes stop_codon:yes gene_type:complete
MGRHKKYVTNSQRKKNNREKSLRYYYRHRDDVLKKQQMKETEMNNWIVPEKVGESFVWYCFSKLTDEEIEDRLMGYRSDFRKSFKKYLQKKSPPINKDDEEMVMKREKEINDEVGKNENQMIDNLVNHLKLDKDSWKGTLGFN